MAGRRIAVLLIGSLVVALGIVAFFQATPSWSFAATVFVPATCALAAVVGILRGRLAPFSIGFAVCAAALMMTVFPLGRPDYFYDLTELMTDYEYAETLPAEGQDGYYERVAAQAPIVGAALMTGVAAIVGLVAMFVAPPLVARLDRHFSVLRLMVAVVVIAAGLALGREQYRNYEGDRYRRDERSRVREFFAKAVLYGQILHEGGIAMSAYHPGSGQPPDFTRFDGYPEIWAAGGAINERIATVLVHGDVRMLVVHGTKISDDARAILRSVFDVEDTGQERCVLSRRSMDGASAPHRTDVTYVQTGRFDRFPSPQRSKSQAATP